MSVSVELRQLIAPSGRLKVAINLGNPILAHTDAATGLPAGVSVDLAAGLAGQLGVAVEWQVFDGAGKSVEAVTQQRADIGFFAVDPVRGAGISFSAPYLLIEGCYLVREDSPLRAVEEVDREGVQVVVGRGSAYDLYLTRELRHAQIVRTATSQQVVDTFISDGLDVAAGVRQQLMADSERIGGLRLLPGRFMQIQQAMGLPKQRGAAASDFLWRYVEALKESGAIAAALARHRISGASVAPPAA